MFPQEPIQGTPQSMVSRKSSGYAHGLPPGPAGICTRNVRVFIPLLQGDQLSNTPKQFTTVVVDVVVLPPLDSTAAVVVAPAAVVVSAAVVAGAVVPAAAVEVDGTAVVVFVATTVPDPNKE
jgi:hypothetical protein